MFPVDQVLTSVLKFAMHVAHFEHAAKIAKTGSATMAKEAVFYYVASYL